MTVVLRTQTPGRRFEIRTRRERELVERCIGRCSVDLPEGDYWVVIPESEGSARGRARLRVEGSGQWLIEDADRDTSNAGLAMGIAGTALIPIGLIVAVVSQAPDGTESDADNQRGARLGLGMLLAGLVLTPVGWVTFGINRGPDLEQVDGGSWDVGFTAGPSGPGLGLTGRF